MRQAGSKIQRFRKRFPEWVFADISACLHKGAAVGATILCCCAVDYLGRFYSGNSGHSMNKAKYVEFLRVYFPATYDPVRFYRFIRCGLVHGYEMQRQYVVVGSRAPWAQSLHMRWDSKHRATLVNPFALYEDVREGFNEYTRDLEVDIELRRRFTKVWSSTGFERPQLPSNWNKFKHMVDPNLAPERVKKRLVNRPDHGTGSPQP